MDKRLAAEILSLRTKTGHVKTSGVNPTTLIVGFLISKELPLEIQETRESIRFENYWEELFPTAEQLAIEIGETVIFGKERALHYAKEIHRYRLTRGCDIWFQLYNVFNLGLFESPDEEICEGVKITVEDKMSLTNIIADGFAENGEELRLAGTTNPEKVLAYVDKTLDPKNGRNKNNYLFNVSVRLVNTIIKIQQWNISMRGRLPLEGRPYLKDLFNSCVLNCLADESLIDYLMVSNGKMAKPLFNSEESIIDLSGC